MPKSTDQPDKPEEKPSFSTFLANIKREALAASVPRPLLERVFRSMQLDEGIVELTKNQPEHVRAPWDYVEQMVSEDRLAGGRQMLARYSDVLQKIEAEFGVNRHILIAIWGVESSYGSGQGERSVVRSLTSLAFLDKRRAAFWKAQLLASLRILANGDITPEKMTGSWAGAMGHTQFMPTTYLDHAVDFDGDGRRDIWTSVADALASTAAYLKASGWRRDLHWGFEVKLPAKFDYSVLASQENMTAADWLAKGVRFVAGQQADTGDNKLMLLLPAGSTGPAFLVSRNFNSILRYNQSRLYALSVGHLADRLAGRSSAFKADWPRHLKPLSKQQRIELQRLLAALGLDTGGIDGILGAQSQIAIRAFQSAQNLPADGFPSMDLLVRLRGLEKQGKTAPFPRRTVTNN